MNAAFYFIKHCRLVRRTANPFLVTEKFEIIIASYLSSIPEQSKSGVDALFDRFVIANNNLISVGKFLAALKHEGLRATDPRLGKLMENLKKLWDISGREGKCPLTQNLTREEFQDVIAPSLPLIYRAFGKELVIPDFVDMTKFTEEFYWKCKSNVDGKVADYIPQLTRVNPNYWAVSICTIDGQRFSIGDVSIPFTLQSTSKPLTYGIALDGLSQEVVHQYVGQEPSGRNFNELILDHNKKPHNPMINAGAIIVCSLLRASLYPEKTSAEKFEFVKNLFQRMAGGEYIGFNNAVFLSERAAADRNYALGFYMREYKCFPENTILKEVMDLYFQCCSLEATCESVAVMTATLANGGICPLTEDKVLKPEAIRDVLSLMHSCGMYDYSGQFAFNVGFPAKSGVSGAMMIVIPNVMGICSWSPPLDQHGNSVRGLQLCESAITRVERILSSGDRISRNLMSILINYPQISQPNLFRKFGVLKYKDMKQDGSEDTPLRKRSPHRNHHPGLSPVHLLFSSVSGDIAALRMHWLSGMDMGSADYDGRTALHLAAAEGHFECVKFLLEQCKVPLGPKDRWGNTPLSEAQNFGRIRIVELITKKAAQMESKKLAEKADFPTPLKATTSNDPPKLQSTPPPAVVARNAPKNCAKTEPKKLEEKTGDHDTLKEKSPPKEKKTDDLPELPSAPNKNSDPK